MKKFTRLAIFIAAVLALGLHGISEAQVLLDENFSYPAGDFITAHGWTAHSAPGTNPITVNSGGLTFTGYIDSGIGNAALVDNTGEDDNKTFAVQSSGIIYTAFMVNMTTVSAGYFFHLGGNPIGTSIFRGKVFVDATNHFGVSVGSTGTFASTTFNTGTTYLLVLKYEIVSGTTNDIVSLFIFDTSIPPTEPGTPNVGPLTDGTQSDISPASVALRQYSATQNFLIDGIRVGMSWGDIIGTFSPPTIQASAINFTSVASTGMTVNWTNGDGAKRIVIMNTTDSFTNPTDGTDPTANTVYGGSSEQVVYNNTSNTVSVTGLSASTTYWFRAYEYNGTGATTKYLTTTATGNPNFQATIAGSVAPFISSPTATSITNNTAVLGGDITADGGSAITERGTVWKTSTGVTITDNILAEGGTATGIFTHTRSSLPVKTQIFYKAYATNIMGTTLTTESSFFTLADEPTTHVDGFAAAAGGTTSINLTWTTAATGADGYLILQKTGAIAPTGIPADATGYTVGSVLVDGTVAALVTPGSSLAAAITGLSPATQYSYTIFPYAWDGANAGTYNYYTGVTVPSASATTNTPPVIIFYDGFTGTDNIGGTGAIGTGNNGWITHSGTGTIPINIGSLTYAPLQASTGNRVTIPGDNATVSRDVNAALSLGTSTVAYYSLLLNVIDSTQIGSAFTDNGYFMNIGNTAGSPVTTLFGRLHAKKVNSGLNYRLGIQTNSGAGASQTEFAADLNLGTTYLVVVKYDFNGASNDIATLWVNPSSLGGTEASGGVSNSGSSSTSATTFASVCIRNSTATPKADIDEVRAGITWADVTPPGVPATTQVTGVVGNLVDTCYNATDSITVAGGESTFIVQSGGSATMIAGQNINYMPGTMVMSGGYMHGYITTNGTYCGTFAPTMVTETVEGAETVPEMEAGAFFKVYPNPTNDNFYLELDPTFRDTKTVVYIFGMVGDLIRQEEVMGNDRYEFSLGGKTPGIYFIRVFCGDKLGSQKIIKQ